MKKGKQKKLEKRNAEKPTQSKKQPKKVSEMQVADILITPEFAENILSEMREYDAAYEKAKAQGTPKAHPMDKLKINGHWKTDEMTVLYAEVCNKVCTRYASSVRTFIKEIGTRAYVKTVTKMLEDEKARDNDNGND